MRQQYKLGSMNPLKKNYRHNRKYNIIQVYTLKDKHSARLGSHSKNGSSTEDLGQTDRVRVGVRVWVAVRVRGCGLG